MKKFTVYIFITFMFCSFFSIGQQPRIPIQNNNSEFSKLAHGSGKINFSGYIGKAGSPITGEMKSAKSAEIVKKECTFFSNDSLKGFDFDGVSNQLEQQNYKLYVEFRNMMYRAQCDFIKNKYNIINFPPVPVNLQHSEPPVTLASSCANLDFEDGSFTNWVGSSGYNTNSNGNLTIPAAGAGTAIFTTNQSIYTCTDINLITSAYGNDPLGFPGLDPSGGSYSARVGGFHINTCNYGGDGFICDGYKWSSVYSNGEILEQTFNVTAANALVSFDYAVVLNDGGHLNGQQPYFHVFVKNALSGLILSSCTQYYVQAPAGSAPPGFINSGYVNTGDNSAVYYKNWTSNSINLTPYIGQSVNIEFVAAGCTAGAHIGYAYVDVTCGPADLIASNTAPCAGSTVIITAPAIAGGSYSWSGPGVTGATTQAVSVTSSGTYSVVVTPSQGAACAYTLTKTITFGGNSVAIASVSNPTICSNNSSLITPSGATTYTLLNTGATGTSFNVTPSSTTTYSIIGESGGCASTNTVTTTITVNTSPAITLSSVSNPVICSGNSSLITPSGASTYTLLNTGATGSSFNVSPTSTTTYSIIGTSSSGCPGTNTLTTTITVNTTPAVSISSVSDPVICLGNSSLITPSGASTYTLLNTGATGNSFNVSPSSTTTYSIIGAASGCVSSNTITTTITVNTSPAVSISSVSNPVICSGNSSLITPSGASTYTLINTGATGTSFNVSPSSTTTYSIIGAASGCVSSNTTTTTITVNTSPAVSISSVSSPVICSGNSSLITPSGANTYTLINTGATGTSFNVTPSSTTTYSIVGESGGCASTNTVTTTITVNTSPAITLSSVSNPVICSGNSSLITPSGASTYTLLNTGATGTSFNVSPTGTTTYSIIGESSANCPSTNTITTTISVNSTPTLALGSNNVSLCTGNTLVLPTASGGGTYSWTGPNAFTSSAASPTVTSSVSSSDAGVYNVNTSAVYGSYTCTSATEQVTVSVVSSAVISVPNANLCEGSTATVTPSGGNSYTLTNTGDVSTGSFTLNPTSTTVYSVSGSAGAGCNGNSTFTITVLPTSTVALTASSNTICSGNSIVLTPNGANTYTLNPGNLTGTSFTVSPALTTTYSVIGTNSANCVSTNNYTVEVNVNTSPTVSLTSNSSTICAGGAVVLTPSGADTYTLNPGGLSGTSFTLFPVGPSDNYSLIGTSLLNCSSTNTANISITVSSLPTFTLGTASSLTATCASPTVNLSATSDAGSNASYTWNTPIPSTVTGNPISASAPGIYTVSVTNTLTGCTNASAQNTVELVADAGIPSVTLSSNTLSITCTNPTVSATASTTSTPVIYNWSPTSGIVAGTETTASPSFTAAGSYSLVVSNTTSGCASSISSNVVNVITDTLPPNISLSLGSNIMQITCADTNAVVNIVTTPSGGSFTYTWSPSVGMSTPINQANATFTAPNIYTLTVTNVLTGCVTSNTNAANTFTVTQNLNTPTISLVPVSTNSIIGCGGNGSTVTYSVNVSSAGPTTNSWSTGATTSTVDITVAGNYSVIVTDNASGCSQTSSFSVSGNTIPPQGVDAGTSANISCGNSSTILTGVSTSSNVNFSWSGPSSTSILSGSNTPAPVVTETGTYVLTVTDNSTGCQNTATVVVSQASVTAAFTANPVTGLSPLTVNFTDASLGATSWSWNFGDANSSSTQNATNVYTTGSYVATLTASSGSCSSTATVIITVEDGLTLEIPNVFTPNNDGSNDIFTIKSTGVKKISLQVFNRWGEKLYEFSGPKASWDGLAPNGILVPEGTYFYFVKAFGFDDKEIERHGTVNLFR